MALHDVAMKDDYFVSRKLAPNVDFWRFALFFFLSFSLALRLILNSYSIL